MYMRVSTNARHVLQLRLHPLPFNVVGLHLVVEPGPIHANMLAPGALVRVVARERVGRLEGRVRSAEGRHTEEVDAVGEVAEGVPARGPVLDESLAIRAEAVELVGDGNDEELMVWAIVDVSVADGSCPEPLVVGLGRVEGVAGGVLEGERRGEACGAGSRLRRSLRRWRWGSVSA